ncbi:MAG: histidine phosphotransferase family protein [Rhodobacterales bacterium]|nr:histidine phosphotransferase family protein [Rhodobacterales bacterium]
MPQSKPNLASLIGSRICHDLISPIGAIGNGLELIEMGAIDGKVSMDGPEMDLIRQSVINANAKIRFFRVAYGIASPGQNISHTEIVSLLNGVTAGGRTNLDWKPVTDFPRTEIKTVLLAFQCLESAMAFGGDVIIRNKDNIWQVSVTNAKLKIDTGLWETLTASIESDPAPKNVQFALLKFALADTERALKVTLSPQEISLWF